MHSPTPALPESNKFKFSSPPYIGLDYTVSGITKHILNCSAHSVCMYQEYQIKQRLEFLHTLCAHVGILSLCILFTNFKVTNY